MQPAPADEARWRALLERELKGAPARGLSLDCGETLPPLPEPVAPTPMLSERPRMALGPAPEGALDGGPVHDAGSDEVQDLGALLSFGLASLRSGAPPESLRFSLRLGTQPLVEIARVRALRLCWARVLELCGLPSAEAWIHARLGDRVLCRYSPWNNALRHAAALFAASVAGVDLFTPVPHDALAGGAGERIATNAAHIAIEESRLLRTLDAAQGSAAVEQLTAILCRRAWAEMQQIEAEGLPALAERVAATHARRVERLRCRKQLIVGVSDFVDADEPRPPDAPPVAEGLFPLRRFAEPFEALRDLSSRPELALLAVGGVAELGPRLSWTRSLLQVGGFQPPDESPGSADEALARFRTHPAPLAVICATDAAYPELVPALVPALRQAGARFVVLAGRPGPHEAAFRAAGVDRFAFLGQDAVTLLSELIAVKP